MAWLVKDKIRQGVLDMLGVNMGLRDGERLLVVTDPPNITQWKSKSEEHLQEALERSVLARMVAEIAAANWPHCSAEFYPFPSVNRHGEEPPGEVAEVLREADAVIALTTYSLSHTDARERATTAGVRIASMPSFLGEMFYPDGPMAVDYRQVEEDSKVIARLLSEAREAVIRSLAGTDLRLSLEGRLGRDDSGIYTARGSWGNLPAGEAYIAPLEGTAEGQIVVPPGWCLGLEEDMVFIIEQGQLRDIRGGGNVRQELLDLLRPDLDEDLYRRRRNVAELGIGSNPNARRPTNVLEAEKIKGTVHLALGDNAHMGGTVSADFHEDFVLPEPDLILDGRTVIERGCWKL
jgi:leucyl aminopeptidase (aminopeptidase T)